MKKICLGILLMLLVAGCSCALLERTPTDAVKTYLDRYNNNDEDVLDELDTYIVGEDFSDEQRQNYRNILTKQYKDLSYKIVDEAQDGDEATVTATVTVYDLYKVQMDAEAYLGQNLTEFNDDEGVYDQNKYIDYRLEQMKKNTDTVDYTITFTLKKVDNQWIVDQLSDTDLQKIHGIYNYESD